MQTLYRAFIHKSKNSITQFYWVPVLFSNYQCHGYTIIYGNNILLILSCDVYKSDFHILMLELYYFRAISSFWSWFINNCLSFKKFQYSGHIQIAHRNPAACNSKARLSPREGIIYEWQRRCTVHVSSHEELQIFLPRAHDHKTDITERILPEAFIDVSI